MVESIGNLNEDVFECCGVVTRFLKLKIVVVGVYRTPNSKVENFLLLKKI